jgi:triacylglycerol esterase/lipase EstA (alpha/beta hydrolase family)
LGDGVTATRVVPDLHLIPGLWKIDGYGKIRQSLEKAFELTQGKNLFEFPYDWRRDNRAAARKLHREVHAWLSAWRKGSGQADAKLILVAHSMGGLVARHFLEVLGGWRDTRCLATFGTPYGGSINALQTLVEGTRIGGLIDVSATMRSFTSVYQLLPTYPCVAAGS